MTISILVAKSIVESFYASKPLKKGSYIELVHDVKSINNRTIPEGTIVKVDTIDFNKGMFLDSPDGEKLYVPLSKKTKIPHKVF